MPTVGTWCDIVTQGCPKWHAALCFFIYSARPPSLHCAHTHTYICCLQTVYEIPLLTNDTAMKRFYTNRSGANCWLDIYRWGAGLAVTGPIRDIGLNVLQYPFVTGSGSSSTVNATFCCLSHCWKRPLLEIQGDSVARGPQTIVYKKIMLLR